jgi:hypothetical protein
VAPVADPSRRVQLRCTPCRAQDSLYMLDSRANLILVTCTNCDALYWLATTNGVGGRPEDVDALPPWPGLPWQPKL